MAAIDGLNSSLTAVRELIRLESAYSDPPDPSDREAAYGLRGAATVLTLACFESFLSSLFEEELQRVSDARIPLREYDDKFRTEAIFASIELATKGDHRTRGKERILRIPDVISTARVISADSFVPRALSSTNSNPNAECVRRMFKTVGRYKIFENSAPEFEKLWGSPVAKTYCEDTLDALVTSRNRVAHAAEAAHVTRNDLAANLRFIETFSEVLSNNLSAHVATLIRDAKSSDSSET